MTEKNEEEQTADLNVTRIFKYTSIKEIFNEILGKSSDSLNVKNAGKKEPQIVVVTSAAGGVGKTTLAIGISACLSQNYKKVLYVNCSRLQSLLVTSKLSLCALYRAKNSSFSFFPNFPSSSYASSIHVYASILFG